MSDDQLPATAPVAAAPAPLKDTSMVVVGDVHGTYKTLQALLKKYPSDQKFCFVGDLVDRGPQSIDVVQFVMDNYDRIKCVRGNHEHMMLDFYARGGRMKMNEIWLANGGRVVEAAYDRRSQKLVDHLDFIGQLPWYLEFEDCKDEDGRHLLVSHSIAVHTSLDELVANESLIWGRHFPNYDISGGRWYNVFGHTPLDMPDMTDWWANIDTGSCFKGHLTALRYPEMEVRMIPSVL